MKCFLFVVALSLALLVVFASGEELEQDGFSPSKSNGEEVAVAEGESEDESNEEEQEVAQPVKPKRDATVKKKKARSLPAKRKAETSKVKQRLSKIVSKRRSKAQQKAAPKKKATAAPVEEEEQEDEQEQGGEEQAESSNTSEQQEDEENEEEIQVQRIIGQAKSQENLQRQYLHNVEKLADSAHKGHVDKISTAKKKAGEANIAFKHAEELVRKAERDAEEAKKVHLRAINLEQKGKSETDKLAVAKLHAQEERLVAREKQEIEEAKSELDHAQKARDSSLAAEREAKLFFEREQRAEAIRQQVHKDKERARLESMNIQHHGKDDPAHLEKFLKEREAMHQRHQKEKEDGVGVQIPVVAAAAAGAKENLGYEVYEIPPVDANEREERRECPTHLGVPCGGPSRGTCDWRSGTCNCELGVGVMGGYFGSACECGYAKDKCLSPLCFWCSSMKMCVKSVDECRKKPKNFPGGESDEFDSADRGHSESVRNEHHQIINSKPHSGLHSIGFVPTIEEEEITQEDRSSGSMAIYLSVFLFAAAVVLALFVFSTQSGRSGKPRGEKSDEKFDTELPTAANSTRIRRPMARNE